MRDSLLAALAGGAIAGAAAFGGSAQTRPIEARLPERQTAEPASDSAPQARSEAPVRESVEHFPEKNELSIKTHSVQQLQEWADFFRMETSVHDGVPSSPVHLDLAVVYLANGRFDSAIAVLEKGQRAAGAGDRHALKAEVWRWTQSLTMQQRRSGSDHRFAPVFEMLLEDAHNLKAALTEARDSLRKQGMDVTYPDERIFVAALGMAPRGDAYLILNIADAWAAAFPKSKAAWRCAAEAYLGYVEGVSRGENALYTDVPYTRDDEAFFRGMGALEKYSALDKDSPYPAIRQMQHLLLRMAANTNDGRTERKENFGSLVRAWSGLDANPDFTYAQKAYLRYGQAMFYLEMDSWGNPTLVDKLIGWLEDAASYAPNSELYAETHAWVETNRQRINQAKLQAHARERARGRRLAQQAFAPVNATKVGVSDNAVVIGAAAAIAGALLLDILLDDSSGESDWVYKTCPACGGSGTNFFTGTWCRACGGTGGGYSRNI